MNKQFNQYLITDSETETDLDFVWNELKETYWAKNIPRELVERSAKHSMRFNVFFESKQIAYARVITDQTTFAYLCDVIVHEKHRGKGLGKAFMQFILEHPELQGLRRFMLATRDAHGLYAQFGFTPLANPQRLMEIVYADMYEKKD
jgi:GNAT superfamily N-acetyltransferase